jgi:hypothetical protein
VYANVRKLMQVDASWCNLTQIDATWCKLTKIDTIKL